MKIWLISAIFIVHILTLINTPYIFIPMETAAVAGKKALVLGGTGAVGKATVLELLRSPSFSKVKTIGRRKVDVADAGLSSQDSEKLEQVVIDMDKMSEYKAEFENFDAAFCCLGSTRKDAGSAENFRKIDFGYTSTFANLCKSAGIRQFHLVSSTGANANSWFLYPKTKGQAEDAVKELHFDHTLIYRPGLLQRPNPRTVEKIAEFFVSGLPMPTIAKAMVRNSVTHFASNQTEKTETFSDSQIRSLGKSQS
eukprot:TRINITY_DN4125_c0_g1_i1.p1 TRINITY_DN4125_c0_g1~~TRINITY_DN4125_c0_g1_i1.p1  ORF type:complete len:253 (-),score=25.74 TRINITY_DN4125_c0_g1_i1:35-793(-)